MIKTEAGGAALTAEGGDRGFWGGASWSAPASEGCQLGKRPSSLGSLVGIGAEGQPREIRLVGITRVTRLCSMEVTAEGSSGHPQKSPTKSHIWTPDLCSSLFVLPPSMDLGNQKQSTGGRRMWKKRGRTEGSHPSRSSPAVETRGSALRWGWGQELEKGGEIKVLMRANWQSDTKNDAVH